MMIKAEWTASNAYWARFAREFIKTVDIRTWRDFTLWTLLGLLAIHAYQLFAGDSVEGVLTRFTLGVGGVVAVVGLILFLWGFILARGLPATCGDDINWNVTFDNDLFIFWSRGIKSTCNWRVVKEIVTTSNGLLFRYRMNTWMYVPGDAFKVEGAKQLVVEMFNSAISKVAAEQRAA